MELKKPLSENDLVLMASFLTESDRTAVKLVQSQLKAALQERPEFQKTLLEIKDAKVKKAIQAFLEESRLEQLKIQFEKFKKQGDKLDLESAVYQLATFAYPDLKRADIKEPLDDLAKEADQLLDAREGDPEEEMNVLRRYLFKIKGFQGNIRQYNDVENSFINRVLERRFGIPITLSCVYLLVAWRLDMIAQGIGLPGHFIVGHELKSGVVLIDPFHEGRILTLRDCETLVRQHGLGFREEYLTPTSNLQILIRMMVNLINHYTEQKETQKASWLTTTLEVLQGSPQND